MLDQFRKITLATIEIVIEYAIHETGLKRFFRFHNLVVSNGYLEKK